MPEQEEKSAMPLQRTAFDILKLYKETLKRDKKDDVELCTVFPQPTRKALDDDKTGLAKSLRPRRVNQAGCSVVLNNIEVQWTGPDGSDDQNDNTNNADNLSAEETRSRAFALKSIFMEIRKGELVVVIGSVGCGKSSLLMALLGEMNLKSGSVTTEGSMTYVSQEPWILSDTLKENILLGTVKREQHYKEVLDACCLSQDLQSMPRGDQTLVGERGWKLSGGQKARLNLARAVYTNADIYLLDDPLSAVDSSVGKHLFDRCISGLLGNKTRILVTHQVQFMSRADRIVIMDKGSIVACGSFEEVSNTERFKDVTSQQTTYKPLGKHSLRTIDEYVTETSPENYYADHESDNATNIKPSLSGMHVWMEYIKSGPGYIAVPLYCAALALTLAAYIGCDWILVRWCSMQLKENYRNDTSSHMFDFLLEGNRSFLLAWTVLLVVVAVASELQSVVFYTFSICVSRAIHRKAFRRVMKAPMTFFENNPVGRILNRFSRDVGFMDLNLPRTLHVTIGVASTLIAQVTFVVVISPWLALATLPLVIGMIFIQQYSITTISDLRRIEAVCRTPVYSLLMDTIRGLPVIRAMNKQKHFTQQFHGYQDRHTSAWFLFFSSFRWLGVRAEWLLSFFMAVCMIIVISAPSVIVGGTGSMGLGLTYLAFILGNLQFVWCYSAGVQAMMTSVERLCEYHTLDQEADRHTNVRPPSEWPSRGEIDIQKLSFQYMQDGSYALKDITIHIKPGEKVGIVGRTGAGKSSLMKCLLRLVEPQGTITIDGIDVSQIGLQDLRSNISVIPQDPIFLAGTLRNNIDPFEEYTEEEILTCLEMVHMKEAISDLAGSLSCQVLESGCNFSVGQKQLLCLARAILRRSAILLVDEATANVDNKTDAIVRETIRERFHQSTVLTIAHRLHTVMDSDRVLVLSEGRVAEFDQPYLLLQDPHSHFYHLVQQADSAHIPDLVQ